MDSMRKTRSAHESDEQQIERLERIVNLKLAQGVQGHKVDKPTVEKMRVLEANSLQNTISIIGLFLHNA